MSGPMHAPRSQASGVLAIVAGAVWLAAAWEITRMPDVATVGHIPIFTVAMALAAVVLAYVATTALPEGRYRWLAQVGLGLTAVVGCIGLVLLGVMGDEQELFGFLDQEWLWWYAYLAFMAVLALVAGAGGLTSTGWTRPGWLVMAIGAAGQSLLGVIWSLSLPTVRVAGEATDLMPLFMVIFGAGAILVGLADALAARRTRFPSAAT